MVGALGVGTRLTGVASIVLLGPLVPTAFVAVTLNVYCVPFVRPVKVTGLLAAEIVVAPSLMV
jgi:hypothetical protein